MNKNCGEFVRACEDKKKGLNLKMVGIDDDNLAKGVKMDTLAAFW